MKPKKKKIAEYMQIINRLIPLGWIPAGEFGTMKFTKSGKTYDLSAADLNKLDEIERKGSFLISE